MKTGTRKWKAWAVIDSCGTLACWDYRLPLTWLRRLAERDNVTLEFGGQVIQVEVRELPKARRGQRT